MIDWVQGLSSVLVFYSVASLSLLVTTHIMYHHHHYYIPLNKTSLLLFHSPSSCLSLDSPSLFSLSTPAISPTNSNPVVVQVTIKPADHNLKDEMAAFYLNQYEITKAIEVLIEAHISTSTSNGSTIGGIETIEIEGDGYMLSCTKKHWSYGKTLSINAGDTVINAAEDKWTFVIHCT